MRRLIYFTYLMVLCAIRYVFAQDLMFTHLPGVPYTSGIKTDSRGFVWISSYENLYQHNGMSSLQFGTKDSLKGFNIQSPVYEDSASNLWFCTQSAIHCYVRKTGKVSHYYLTQEDGTEIREGYHIFDLDAEGYLLIKAEHLLFRFDTRSLYQPRPSFVQIYNDYSGYHIVPLRFPVKGKTECYLADLNDEIITCRIKPQFVILDTIDTQLMLFERVQAPDGSLWFGSGKGLLHISQDLSTQKLYPIPWAPGTELLSLALWQDSILWVGSKGEGLLSFNMKTKTFARQQKHDLENPYSLAGDHISRVRIDKNGNLWAEVYEKGVDHTNLHHVKFQSILLPSLDKLSPYERLTPHKMEEDEDGNIWISSHRSGAVRYNPRSRSFDHIVKLDGLTVHALPVSPHQVFISNLYHGLYLYDTERKTRSQLPGPESLFCMLKIGYQRFLACDGDSGIWDIRQKGSNWVVEQIKDPYIHEKQWGMLYMDDRGHIFAGQGNTHLVIFDQDLKKLPHDSIPFIGEVKAYAENDTAVWAAGDFGIISVNKNTLKHHLYTATADRVPDAGVNGLLSYREGDSSYLWISTSGGLFRYNLSQKTCKKFQQMDGLPSTQFSLHSSLATSDGRFWFGSSRGLVSFHPGKVRNSGVVPFQYVSSITVNEKPYVSDSSIIELRHLSLPYGSNNVNIVLNAVEFSDPQHNSLRYNVAYESNHWIARLARTFGWQKTPDTAWTYVNQPLASISFKNMVPGTYAISFLAISSDGDWAKHINTFTIEIAQPWWQSPWFMLLMVALAAGTVTAISRYRIDLIRKEAKRQVEQALLETKAARAQMNTHFLSNALETVSGFILKAEQLKASKLISKIAALMRNVFKNSANAFISLHKELEIVEQYIEVETAGWDSQAAYNLEIDEQIDEGQLMIPGLLLQTIVENALRHGLKTKEGEKNLSLHITRETSLPAVRFTITDNGVGRPKDKRDNTDGELHATGITYDRLKLYDIHFPGEFTSRMDITDLEDAQGTPLGTRVDILLGMPKWAKNTSSESV